MAALVSVVAFLAPGRLAPAAMPSPLTGAAGAASAVGVAVEASAVLVSAAVFLAPGRLAPVAMPSPFTGAGAASVAAAASAGAAAFLAPGRLAPVAMPRPETGFASAAGAAASAFVVAGASSSATTGSGSAVLVAARSAAAAAAVPLAGNAFRMSSVRPTDSSRSCATSTTSTAAESSRAVTPSVNMTRQNGQPVAILDAGVDRASSTRSMLMRLPSCSSIHMRAPPAPQHMERSPCLGISVIAAPEAPISSRGAVYTLLWRPR
ncbi:Uncharacterised protein [Mycobacteroides abscessus]|nr:Uncharacterised protein [Mycobacteroides abscessus]